MLLPNKFSKLIWYFLGLYFQLEGVVLMPKCASCFPLIWGLVDSSYCCSLKIIMLAKIIYKFSKPLLTISLIGRSSVGKSSLFNKLQTGENAAITSNQKNITRDRKEVILINRRQYRKYFLFLFVS